MFKIHQNSFLSGLWPNKMVSYPKDIIVKGTDVVSLCPTFFPSEWSEIISRAFLVKREGKIVVVSEKKLPDKGYNDYFSNMENIVEPTESFSRLPDWYSNWKLNDRRRGFPETFA